MHQWCPGRWREKKPQTRPLHRSAARGALGGSFWGLLFGIVFFVPILGMAVGAVSGALSAASLRGAGISEEFINTVRDKVKPGTSALFLLSSAAVLDRLKAEFQDSEAELITTDLSQEQETKLREVFTDED